MLDFLKNVVGIGLILYGFLLMLNVVYYLIGELPLESCPNDSAVEANWARPVESRETTD